MFLERMVSRGEAVWLTQLLVLSCDIGSDSTAHGCQTGYVFHWSLSEPSVLHFDFLMW